MDNLHHYISLYGYPGIFLLLVFGIVGLPIPDETMLALAGYMVFKGTLRFLPTVATAFIGTTCGITSSYVLGRTLGLFVIKKYGSFFHISDKKLDRVHSWFGRTGKWSLTFGYFIPGVRHLTALVAGSSKLELPMFALFAYSGGFLWSLTFISLGYFLGDGWEQTSEELHHYLLVGVGLVALCALLFALVHQRRR
jgi:membrane protein DedA with SNARE-associated domain